MAKQTQSSSLATKIKAKAKDVFDASKATEPTYDTGGNLPAGIEGGIAQLVDCCVKKIKEGKQNAGELMFYAAGVVVSPEEHGGVRIKGLRTNISEFLFDTPTRSRTTFAEHLDWVLNEMKKLGADLSETSEDEVEDVMAALKEQQPYFRFRTWVGAKNTEGPYKDREPMVNHIWSGVKGLEDYVSDDADAGVVDETGDEEPEETPAPVKGKSTKTRPAPVEEEAAEEGEADLAALAESADGGDADAQRELEKLASEAGVDAASIATWAEVVEAMQAGGEAAEESEPEAEEAAEVVPEKGEVYSFKAKGQKKAVDHEVVAVLPKAKTVTLKNLDTGALVKGVGWSDLQG